MVYSSATGATDVRNMAYMTRLGLWGIGTSFPGGFQEFMQEIESGGVGAMEMVSRDMKALGMYLSGSISFGVVRKVVKRLSIANAFGSLRSSAKCMTARRQPAKCTAQH